MRAGVSVDWLPGVRYYWALAARAIWGPGRQGHTGNMGRSQCQAGQGEQGKGQRSNDNTALGVEIITSGLVPTQSRLINLDGPGPVPICTWQF